MVAKVENYCIKRNDKSIHVNSSERACLNCIWYEQYYRKNCGNIKMWVPTSTEYCLLKNCRRGALKQGCKNFETEGGERSET